MDAPSHCANADQANIRELVFNGLLRTYVEAPVIVLVVSFDTVSAHRDRGGAVGAQCAGIVGHAGDKTELCPHRFRRAPEPGPHHGSNDC